MILMKSSDPSLELFALAQDHGLHSTSRYSYLAGTEFANNTPTFHSVSDKRYSKRAH